MLVSLERVSKAFGEKLILDDINITIEDKDRIGLIGANGIGKSTLLNIICKKLSPNPSLHAPGMVHVGRGVTIGLLEQNSGLDVNATIYEQMQSVFSKVHEAEKKLHELEALMANSEHDENYEQLCAEYSKLTEYFEMMDGYHIDVKIKTVLNGMGFADKAYDTVIGTMSGGEKTRLALAKLLLEEPSLLILDEPTNHLDFKTLMWLEDYLQGYKGGLLVVSHDRYFLDKMVQKIWEIENRKVICYKGNYSKYKELRAERIARQLKEYEAQQNKINSMRDYAERNIVRASTSNMAKSRLHQLEHIEELEKPIERIPTPHFSFTFERNPIKDVLAVNSLSLRVGEEQRLLCDNISFEVKRGEKIALIGPNGIGKSTLLKSLMGRLSQQGEIRWGANTRLGYYEQENETLNPENTAMDELWNRFPKLLPYDVRSMLGQVLLTGDNVFKKVKVLSGGERARLAFAIIMSEHSNTLLLDEPTNHLDLQSKEELEKSLVEFEGTLIIVSHDRYFLNAIPTKIIEMTRESLNVYEGNFDFYLEQVKKNTSDAEAAAAPFVATVTAADSMKKSSFYRSKQDRREEAMRKSRIKELELLLRELEEDIIAGEAEMALPEIAADYERLGELCSLVAEKRESHDEAFLEWAELAEKEN